MDAWAFISAKSRYSQLGGARVADVDDIAHVRKVLVVGNIAVDVFFTVDHIPRPGETLLATREGIDVGGKGLNQAIAAARAGASVRLCSAIGSDGQAHTVSQRIREEGLDPADLLVRPGPTDHSIIYKTPEGQNCIVSTCTAASAIGVEDVAGVLRELQGKDILLMQGNLSTDTTLHCVLAARERGSLVIVNAAPIGVGLRRLLSCVDVLIVNEVENHILSRRRQSLQGAEVLLRRGARTVITTLGAKGALLCEDDLIKAVAAPEVTVADSTGAGDVFCGVFTAGLAGGQTTETACRWAVSVAALSVTRQGTLAALPTQREMAALREGVIG
ncbi:MAG: ribokinase [Candidatus Dormibacteria bacterium]